jgi:hypothetical protein
VAQWVGGPERMSYGTRTRAHKGRAVTILVGRRLWLGSEDKAYIKGGREKKIRICQVAPASS